ncbi:Glucagon-1 [Merluccius polli]|uniref:Glucagon-1 n=1 Tax=Merluccius polli TaxID=89951 RepID=A0AA47NNR3_MERPO|nr:Glucagon-1 [Merluccius polli]
MTKRITSTVWHTYEIEKGQNIIKNFKRHADGTFTSDFTHYLDKMKAKDFVEWLISNKRMGIALQPIRATKKVT